MGVDGGAQVVLVGMLQLAQHPECAVGAQQPDHQIVSVFFDIESL